MKEKINSREIIKDIVEGLEKGQVLLCCVDENGKPNAMAIGWGTVGIIWNRPVFVAFVRPSRYTYQLIEKTGDFTVNIADEGDKEIVNYCGTVSGKTHDKFKEKNLTPLKSEYIKSPLIKECRINIECKVIAKVDLIPEFVDEKIKKEAYPSGNYHRIYFGEILACYKS